VVVVPESGGVLLERVSTDAGLAGDKPIFGVTVVFGGGPGAVKVSGGADIGHVVATAMKGVVDGQEVFGGEVVDPTNLERLAGARFDERGKCAGTVAPHTGSGDVAMNLGVDLLHVNGEGAVAVLEGGADDLWERECVDERSEGEGGEHPRADARRIGFG